MKGFKNSNIYIEGIGIKNTSLTINNGLISSIGENTDEDDYIELPPNQILVPGFIDEHTHGANGADSMNGNRESLETIAKSIPEEGTTSFLFTTMTMRKDIIIHALNTIADYLKNPLDDASFALGVHLEGPFISSSYCGAQNKEDILPLNLEDLKEFIHASNDNIREMTFSYKTGHDDFIEYAKDHHIALSLGHTDDTAKEAKECFDKGIRLTTHTFNAMKPFHHREAGAVGALLLDDRVSSELILDLHHVCHDSARLLFKIKGKNKITLITDSMEAKYLPDGQYQLGGNPVIVKEGTARLFDGTLAGSILKMNVAIRNAVKVFNIPLTDAIDMATINPATNLGFDKCIGSIKVGKKADFAVIDSNVDVYQTISSGRTIYKKEN